MTSKTNRLSATMLASGLAVGAIALGAGIQAQAQYRDTVGNDMSECRAGQGPAVLVTVDGVRAGGKVRVQSYRATSADWLQKGKWLSRIESAARPGAMTFCVPVPAAGSYAIAVRHDKDGNGKTDLTSDGGGMSNNPSINIFNLGKPSVSKTAFAVGPGVKSIRIQMRYMGS